MIRQTVFYALVALLAAASLPAMAQDRGRPQTGGVANGVSVSGVPQTGGVANGVSTSSRPWASLHSVVSPSDMQGGGVLGAPINMRPGGFVAPVANYEDPQASDNSGDAPIASEPAPTSVQAYNNFQNRRGDPQATASYDASWVSQGLNGQRLDTSASSYNQRLFDSKQSDANRSRAVIPSPFPPGFGE
jgi:hypothetical protein